jgi:hypothetical protein
VFVVGEVVRLHEQLDWFPGTVQALSIKHFQEAFISL